MLNNSVIPFPIFPLAFPFGERGEHPRADRGLLKFPLLPSLPLARLPLKCSFGNPKRKAPKTNYPQNNIINPQTGVAVFQPLPSLYSLCFVIFAPLPQYRPPFNHTAHRCKIPARSFQKFAIKKRLSRRAFLSYPVFPRQTPRIFPSKTISVIPCAAFPRHPVLRQPNLPQNFRLKLTPFPPRSFSPSPLPTFPQPYPPNPPFYRPSFVFSVSNLSKMQTSSTQSIQQATKMPAKTQYFRKRLPPRRFLAARRTEITSATPNFHP